jgi:hypothetical protein
MPRSTTAAPNVRRALVQGLVTDISLAPARVAWALMAIVMVLFALHLVGLVFRYALDDFVLRDSFVQLFSLDRETNVPTWYSSSALLLCAVLLGAIAYATKRRQGSYVAQWWILCVIFAYLSVDEAAAIHEHASQLRASLGASGIFFYSWVIPAGILVGLFAAAFFRFLLALPFRTRALFAIAGVGYVGSGLGIEMVSGAHAELFGGDNLVHRLISTSEEMLEMTSVVFFIYAILDYMRSSVYAFRVEPAIESHRDDGDAGNQS